MLGAQQVLITGRAALVAPVTRTIWTEGTVSSEDDAVDRNDVPKPSVEKWLVCPMPSHVNSLDQNTDWV